MEEQTSFFTKKNIINLLFLGIMVLALPIGTQLIKSQKIFKSFAAAESIKFITDGKNVVDRAGKQVAISPTVTLEITSKDGLPSSQADSGNTSLTELNYSPVTKVYAYEACGADPGVDPDDPEDDQCYCDGEVAATCNCEGNCPTEAAYPTPDYAYPTPAATYATPYSDTTPTYAYPTPEDTYPTPYSYPTPASEGGVQGGPTCPNLVGHFVGCNTDTLEVCDVYKDSCTGNWPVYENCKKTPGECGVPKVDASLAAAAAGSTEVDKDAECSNKFNEENGGSIYYCDDVNFDTPKCIEKKGGSLDGVDCADVFSEVDGYISCPGTPCVYTPPRPRNLSPSEASATRNAEAQGNVVKVQPGGVAPGVGGCCESDADCDKAGNTYKGESTKGWKCSDKNPSCKGGNACLKPGGVEQKCFVCRNVGGKNVWRYEGDNPNETCTDAPSSCSENKTGTCKGPNSTLNSECGKGAGGTSAEKCYVCDNSQWRLSGRDGACPANVTRTCQAGKDVNQVCKSTTVNVDDNCVSTKPYTLSFRVAENSSDLSSAPSVDYTVEQMRVNYTFKDPKPGKKFIYVEFSLSDGKKVRANSVSIDLVPPSPEISSLSCDLDAAGTGITMTFKGKNFGAEEGKLSTTGNLKVLSWKDDVAIGLLENVTARSKDDLYRVTLTRSDSEKIQETCGVGVTLISLGAKLFCRAPSQHTQDNVEVEILENTTGSKKVKEKVKIDKEGVVQGIKTKIEDGKVYKVALKAPKSLRRVVTFTAANGTTSVPQTILPVGDIYPRDGGDGKINSLDAAELRRQWGKASTASKNCDFNQDGICNSFEWACMKYDFNKEDDTEVEVDVNVATSSARPR